MRLSANAKRSSPLILRVRPVTPLPMSDKMSFIDEKGSAEMIQEHTAVADFVAMALCVTMGRGFSECFRKDIAVAVPDCIAIG